MRSLARFAPGVRVVLVVILLVPVSGLGWLAAIDVRQAGDQVAKSENVVDLVDRLNTTIEIDALLDAESYWASALTVLTEAQIPPAVIQRVTGLDLEAGLADVRQAVDARLEGDAELAQLSDRIDALRASTAANPAVDSIAVSYGEVVSDLTASIDRDLSEIRALSPELTDSGGFDQSVRTLELAVDLRQSLSFMTENYFAARYPVGDISRQAEQDLLAWSQRYDDAVTDLELLIADYPGLAAAWQELQNEPAVSDFMNRAATLNQLTGASDSVTGAELVTGLSGIQMLDESDSFVGSLDAVEQHVQFAQLAADDVVARSLETRSEAVAARQRVVILVLILLAATLLAVTMASLWIVTPLRRMALVVERLRAGEQSDRIWEGGPAEVKAAAMAVNEAVENMSIAEEMADALARRDLDSPALDVEPRGRLGASLRDTVAALADSIAEREELRVKLVHEASHDGLTGVANRADLMLRLGDALVRNREQDEDLAVLFVDIDRFKAVNDINGHLVGDEVLRAIAHRVQEAVRLTDHVGRVGGDEFVVIAHPVDGREAATQLAERILASVAKGLQTGGLDLELSASIGVALASPGSTPDGLLREADLALYEAKAEGRARMRFCDDELKERQARRMAIERDLERAIHLDDLELWFQPVVCARTGAHSSAEALLRWPLPDGGFLSPVVFIPIAERSDLILQLDEWVLRRAATQMREWDESGMAGLTVAVNISARHLSDPDLLCRVLGPLEANGVEARRLTIEVTETALVDDIHKAAHTLADLRSAGVRIAIDDFGTGYASLAHLRRLPVDVLKIDRSFIAGIDSEDDRSLVQLAIDTGHLLGATITAEGTETPEQITQLTAMGSDLLQGFGVARPMPAGDLLVWMGERFVLSVDGELIGPQNQGLVG